MFNFKTLFEPSSLEDKFLKQLEKKFVRSRIKLLRTVDIKEWEDEE
jgi:hypothetical protein